MSLNDGAGGAELGGAGLGGAELGGVGDFRPSRRRRFVLAGVALAAISALVLSSCAPILGLIERSRSGVPAAPAPEVNNADFAAQQPEWQRCGDGMLCARVKAPLDWHDPGGEQIELQLVKQPALGGNPLGTLFVNPGGPGASGFDYIFGSIDYGVGQPLQQAYDVIGWDPRGVGRSSPVACLDDAGMDDYLFGTADVSEASQFETGSDEWIDAALEDSAAFGETCLDATGELLGHVGTSSTVQDLDMLRSIAGDDVLNYLGYSYGTYIGARYAEAYPQRVGRLVLDGAIDPASSLAEVVREQTRGFELSLRSYVADCLTRADCPVSGSVDEAMAQWRAMLDAVEAQSLTGDDGRTVDSGTVLTAIIMPLYSQHNWPMLDQLYLSVRGGSAEVALQLADYYYDRQGGSYQSNLITAFSAINCLDYPRQLPLDRERMRAEAAELEAVAPTIGAFQGYGDVSCAAWPVPGVDSRDAVSAEGAAPILVIGTTGDPATPLRWAESLAAQLRSGALLVYEGEGHTAYGENACVNEAVERYFLTGETPQAGARCA